MKVSISLPEQDVSYLDAYASERNLPTRSAAVHRAVTLLRESELDAAYEEAYRDWEDSGEARAWDSTAGDGLGS